MSIFLTAEAYPRPRGGAGGKPRVQKHVRGLSPPARGSPSRRPRWKWQTGPIPARAGEPSLARCSSWMAAAYPRPRGGAGGLYNFADANVGLSPPARGSLLQLGDDPRQARPIPARAGEPDAPDDPRSIPGAYPRPRGGAMRSGYRARSVTGLSPPARGSQNGFLRHGPSGGPIPARAGEPCASSTGSSSETAYPRPRGGAITRPAAATGNTGLSPPARGSRGPANYPEVTTGPIPARAGEPPPRHGAREIREAYPRPRGGATGLSASVAGL